MVLSLPQSNLVPGTKRGGLQERKNRSGAMQRINTLYALLIVKGATPCRLLLRNLSLRVLLLVVSLAASIFNRRKSRKFTPLHLQVSEMRSICMLLRFRDGKVSQGRKDSARPRQANTSDGVVRERSSGFIRIRMGSDNNSMG